MTDSKALSAFQSDSLPSAEVTLAAIARDAGDPTLSIGKLSRLVSIEPGLTLELLQAANRSVIKPGTIRTVQQAIGRLGFRFVRNRAVARVVRQAADGLSVGDLDTKRHWEDSLRRAMAAKVLAELLGHSDPEEVFTVGLLQEVGTLVMAAHDPTCGGALERVSREPSETRMRVEKELFGVTHDQVVGVLGRAWGLPDDILLPIEHHHRESRKKLPRDLERTAELLHVADLIADLVVTNGDERVVNLCRKALTGLPGRTDVALAEVLERVQSGLPGIAKELGIELGKQISIQEVLTYATASLVQINQGYENLILKLEDALQQKQDLTRLLERKNLELEALAATDPLTGAANRRRFSAVAQRTLKQHGEKGLAISILAFDLDHFKLVNDTHGHKAGDAVLVEVVRRLNLSLRPDDLVGRLGGEEFAVLLPGTDQEGARLAAERCRRRIADTPIDCEEVSLDITTSIGGSTHCRVVSMETILHEADAALYAAKAGGRNQVVWYGEEPKRRR